MNNKYVTLETAKLAKAAGFDESCDHYYFRDSEDINIFKSKTGDNYIKWNSYKPEYTAAPTRVEVSKYLKLNGLTLLLGTSTTNCRYGYIIKNINQRTLYSSHYYMNHLDALEAGLRKGLEYLINDSELLNKNNNMDKTKNVQLTLEQARELYKDEKWRDILLNSFTKEELIKPNLPKHWEELEFITGYFIRANSTTHKTTLISCCDMNKMVYATEKEADAALAMAQLSQLLKAYNGDWTPDWNDDYDNKYVIARSGYNIVKLTCSKYYYFLTFKTVELRDEFLKNFEDLIKQYFMI